MTKTAKIFKNGRSQAVRLPVEFRFEGSEVDIRRDPASGDVVLSQHHKKTETWKNFLEFVARLRAEAPDEFEGFLENRNLHSSRRDPFE
jgi:antitoxin VapB